MLNEIIQAIAKQVGSLYGDRVPVLTEEPGGERPASYFLVKTRSVSVDSLLNTRQKRNQSFEVSYVPAGQANPQAEINAAFDRVPDALDTITLEDERTLRGTKMECKLEEGVGYIYIHYDVVVRKSPAPVDLMETLDVMSATKE